MSEILTSVTGKYGELHVLPAGVSNMQVYPLQPGRYTIGSSLEANIRIYNNDVQPRHCFIQVHQNKMATLSPISSFNPTILNGKTIGKSRKEMLNPGDIIHLGDVQITYENSTLTEQELATNRNLVLKPTLVFCTPRKKFSVLSTPRSGARKYITASPRSAARGGRENLKQTWSSDVLRMKELPSRSSIDGGTPDPVRRKESISETPSKQQQAMANKSIRPVTSRIPIFISKPSSQSSTDDDEYEPEVPTQSTKIVTEGTEQVPIIDLVTPKPTRQPTRSSVDIAQSETDLPIVLRKTPRSALKPLGYSKSEIPRSVSKLKTPCSTVATSVKTPKSILKSSKSSLQHSVSQTFAESKTPQSVKSQSSLRLEASQDTKSPNKSFSTVERTASSPALVTRFSTRKSDRLSCVSIPSFMEAEDIGEPYDRSKLSTLELNSSDTESEEMSVEKRRTRLFDQSTDQGPVTDNDADVNSSHVSSVASTSFEYMSSPPYPSALSRQSASVFEKVLLPQKEVTPFNVSGVIPLKSSPDQKGATLTSKSFRKSLRSSMQNQSAVMVNSDFSECAVDSGAEDSYTEDVNSNDSDKSLENNQSQTSQVSYIDASIMSSHSISVDLDEDDIADTSTVNLKRSRKFSGNKSKQLDKHLTLSNCSLEDANSKKSDADKSSSSSSQKSKDNVVASIASPNASSLDLNEEGDISKTSTSMSLRGSKKFSLNKQTLSNSITEDVNSRNADKYLGHEQHSLNTSSRKSRSKLDAFILPSNSSFVVGLNEEGDTLLNTSTPVNLRSSRKFSVNTDDKQWDESKSRLDASIESRNLSSLHLNEADVSKLSINNDKIIKKLNKTTDDVNHSKSDPDRYLGYNQRSLRKSKSSLDLNEGSTIRATPTITNLRSSRRFSPNKDDKEQLDKTPKLSNYSTDEVNHSKYNADKSLGYNQHSPRKSKSRLDSSIASPNPSSLDLNEESDASDTPTIMNLKSSRKFSLNDDDNIMKQLDRTPKSPNCSTANQHSSRKSKNRLDSPIVFPNPSSLDLNEESDASDTPTIMNLRSSRKFSLKDDDNIMKQFDKTPKSPNCSTANVIHNKSNTDQSLGYNQRSSRKSQTRLDSPIVSPNPSSLDLNEESDSSDTSSIINLRSSRKFSLKDEDNIMKQLDKTPKSPNYSPDKVIHNKSDADKSLEYNQCSSRKSKSNLEFNQSAISDTPTIMTTIMNLRNSKKISLNDDMNKASTLLNCTPDDVNRSKPDADTSLEYNQQSSSKSKSNFHTSILSPNLSSLVLNEDDVSGTPTVMNFRTSKKFSLDNDEFSNYPTEDVNSRKSEANKSLGYNQHSPRKSKGSLNSSFVSANQSSLDFNEGSDISDTPAPTNLRSSEKSNVNNDEEINSRKSDEDEFSRYSQHSSNMSFRKSKRHLNASIVSPNTSSFDFNGEGDVSGSSTVRNLRSSRKFSLVSDVDEIRSPKSDITGVMATPTTPGSVLGDTTVATELFKTPKEQNLPKNDLSDVSGVKRLMKTPGIRVRNSPVNDLRDVKGIKRLMKTPKVQHSPANDLTNIQGVKKLMATPRVQNSPANDLLDIRGVKRLMKTPKEQHSPVNDLSDIHGVKKLMTTPKIQNPPANDLRDVRGIKNLMKTPKVRHSPLNDLRDVRGVKKLLKTPRVQHSPANDLTDIQGVKKLMATPRVQNSPTNDLLDVRGVKKLMKTPKVRNTPRNDLSDVEGVKELMQSPNNTSENSSNTSKSLRTPKLRKSRNDPLNINLDNLLEEAEVATSDEPQNVQSSKSDYTDVGGVKRLFAEAEAAYKSDFNVSGVADIFQADINTSSSEAFDMLINKRPVRTYRGKSSSPAKLNRLTVLRKSVGAAPAVSPDVVEWVEMHGKYVEKDSTSLEKSVTLSRDSPKGTPLKRPSNISEKTPSTTPSSSKLCSKKGTTPSTSNVDVVTAKQNEDTSITTEVELANIFKDVQNLTPLPKRTIKGNSTPNRRTVKENVTPVVERLDELIATPQNFVSPAAGGGSARKSQRSHRKPARITDGFLSDLDEAIKANNRGRAKSSGKKVNKKDEKIREPSQKLFSNEPVLESDTTSKPETNKVVKQLNQQIKKQSLVPQEESVEPERHRKPVSDIGVVVKANKRGRPRSSTKKVEIDKDVTEDIRETLQKLFSNEPALETNTTSKPETNKVVKQLNQQIKKPSLPSQEESEDPERHRKPVSDIDVVVKANKRGRPRSSTKKVEKDKEVVEDIVGEALQKLFTNESEATSKPETENVEEQLNQQIKKRSLSPQEVNEDGETTEQKPKRRRLLKKNAEGNKECDPKEDSQKKVHKRATKKVNNESQENVPQQPTPQSATVTRTIRRPGKKVETDADKKINEVQENQRTRRGGIKKVEVEETDTSKVEDNEKRTRKREVRKIENETLEETDTVKVEDNENQRGARKRGARRVENETAEETDMAKVEDNEKQRVVRKRGARRVENETAEETDTAKVEDNEKRTRKRGVRKVENETTEVEDNEKQRVTRQRGARKVENEMAEETDTPKVEENEKQRVTRKRGARKMEEESKSSNDDDAKTAEDQLITRQTLRRGAKKAKLEPKVKEEQRTTRKQVAKKVSFDIPEEDFENTSQASNHSKETSKPVVKTRGRPKKAFEEIKESSSELIPQPAADKRRKTTRKAAVEDPKQQVESDHDTPVMKVTRRGAAKHVDDEKRDQNSDEQQNPADKRSNRKVTRKESLEEPKQEMERPRITRQRATTRVNHKKNGSASSESQAKPVTQEEPIRKSTRRR